MPSLLGFLSLPRELRDTIYHHYVFEIDGYHFDHKSGKLRTSDNRSINLNLMYTCSFVATEMHHLALRSNVVNFFPLETERKNAALFDLFHFRLKGWRAVALGALKVPAFQVYKTPDVDAEAALRFPQFEPLISRPDDPNQYGWSDLANSWCGLDGSSWGEADSVLRAFQEYMIKLLSRDTDFPEALANFLEKSQQYPADGQPLNRNIQLLLRVVMGGGDKCERASSLRRVLRRPGPELWSIPSKEEFAYIKTCLGSYTPEGSFWELVKWRFSAAAVAIHFLNSLSQNTRLGIRKVVLHEDRRSVAHPECHALGLIPFCVENPQLYIERRVNIWRVLISECSGENTHRYEEELKRLADGNETEKRDFDDKYIMTRFSRSCCRWITEASALAAEGMPIDSFSLLLDGDPAPDQGWKLFDLVKEDAAWQTAQAQWHADRSLDLSFTDRFRMAGFYLSEVFPQAVDDIVNGKKSPIRCNFPTGDLYDPGEIFKRNRHLTSDYEWLRAWHSQRLRNPIRTSPPLPALLADILLEDVMDEEPADAARRLALETAELEALLASP